MQLSIDYCEKDLNNPQNKEAFEKLIKRCCTYAESIKDEKLTFYILKLLRYFTEQ